MALYFTETHEWVKSEGDIATIGISDYAQNELGDIVYIEIKSVGSKLSRGDTLGVIESVKAASDIYSPISGEIVEVNEAVVDDPGLVNKDPQNNAWFAKLRVSNPDELKELLSEDDYRKLIEV